MANFRIALAPYMGYFIIKFDHYKYCINRIINPAKVTLRGKDAIYHLNMEDIAYVGVAYSLSDAHAFIRNHKKTSTLDNQMIWDMQTKLMKLKKEEVPAFWDKAKKLGIKTELQSYISYPVNTGGILI